MEERTFYCVISEVTFSMSELLIISNQYEREVGFSHKTGYRLNKNKMMRVGVELNKKERVDTGL